MTCERCGRQTPRSHLCRLCGVEERRESGDTSFEMFECPECGEETSGKGVVCYRCR